jgi:hypothetical protein
VEVHIMQKGPLTGYVPDFSEYAHDPVSLPNPVPPGISVQALGTFSMQLTKLELASLETHDAMMFLELGIPRGAILYDLTLIEPLGWQGYTVEVLGTVAELTDPPDAPRFTDMVDQENTLTILAWRRRVYCRGITGYLEVLWHPEREDDIALKGLEWSTTQESLILLQRGLRLLKALEVHGGRPPDIEDEATFRQLYWDAYQNVLEEKRRDGSKRPTKTEVAAEMLISPKTLKRQRKRWGLPFPPRSPR